MNYFFKRVVEMIEVCVYDKIRYCFMFSKGVFDMVLIEVKDKVVIFRRL